MPQPNASAVSRVTAPGAAAVLATLADFVNPGTYRVDVYASFTGAAPAAADAANINLRLGGAVLWAVPVDPIQNQQQLFTYIIQANVPSTIDLVTIGAGTAAVVYQTQIVVTETA